MHACYEIGTATTDSSGLYKLMWTPEIEGTYTVYATFDGSDSYWGSYATTAVGVTKAIATTTPVQLETSPDNTALHLWHLGSCHSSNRHRLACTIQEAIVKWQHQTKIQLPFFSQ